MAYMPEVRNGLAEQAGEEVGSIKGGTATGLVASYNATRKEGPTPKGKNTHHHHLAFNTRLLRPGRAGGPKKKKASSARSALLSGR